MRVGVILVTTYENVYIRETTVNVTIYKLSCY